MFTKKWVFSRSSYIELIDQFFNNGYSFITFGQKGSEIDNPNVIVRHDVDISPKLAYELASLEHQKGVRATYFFALRSPFYNILCKPNIRYVFEIHEMGHDIGTHIDFSMYGGQSEKALGEVSILRDFFPFLNPNIVSLHHPGNLDQIKIFSRHQCVANVYDGIFTKEIYYISDSTGQWRYGHPYESEAFKNKKNIQLLMHPVWWIANGRSPKEKINNWLSEQKNLTRHDAAGYLPSLFR